MKVIQVMKEGDNQKLIVENLQEAQDIIFGDDLAVAEVGEKYTIEIIEMAESELSKLGDFDGF